ncbi:MAG: LysR family transcriptional regulator [Oscillospiraceae bacterium]|nr:LysR family transcriptional regulator [Oscillospiraceae bacterium]
MDFRQLEYVITVAREHTLLAASEKLFLSPSALSQHISKLEEELHTPLFKRTKQGWTPTHAGQIYIEMAENILQSQKKAYLQIGDIADNKIGHFTVGITPGRGTQMFSAIFPKFRAKFPDVKVNLFEGSVQENNEKIDLGKVDIGFLTSDSPHPNIITRTQLTEEILLVVPRNHPMSSLADTVPRGEFATVALNEFENDEFLLAGEGTTLRRLENQLFQKTGFSPKISFETPSLSTLNMLSKGGYGISFLPRFYATETKDAVYFKTEPAASWDLIAAYRKDHYITKAEEYMISLANDYYARPYEPTW